MKKISVIAAVLLLFAGCAPKPADCLLSGKKVVPGISVIATSECPPGFSGMTVRTVSFVNESDKPVTVDAM